MQPEPNGPDFLGNIQIRFPVTFSVVASLVLVGLTATYLAYTASIKETLIFFLAGAAAVGQVTAAFYTARMLAATLAIRRQDLAHERRKTAMQFGSRWNDPGMYHVRDVLRELLDHNGSHDDLIRIIEEKRTNVVHVINFLEEIATSKREGLSDAALLHAQFSGVVMRAWSKALPWIQDHRQKRSDPDLWEDLERLYNEWHFIRQNPISVGQRGSNDDAQVRHLGWLNFIRR